VTDISRANGIANKEERYDRPTHEDPNVSLSRPRSRAPIQHRGANTRPNGGERAASGLLVPGPRSLYTHSPSLAFPDYGTFYAGVPAAREAIGHTREVIRDWLMSTGVHFVLGRADVGKSQLLIHLALSLASGQDTWFGQPMQQNAVVLYANGEHSPTAVDYAEAWHVENGVSMAVTAPRFFMSQGLADLRSKEQARELVEYIRMNVPVPDDGQLVVIVDTWQQATGDANPNDPQPMIQAMMNAEYISQELSCPIVAAVHPPKGNGSTISGTGIQFNRSSAEWLFVESGSTGLLTLTAERYKGGKRGSKLLLKRKGDIPISGHDQWGYPYTSAVLVLRDKEAQAATERPKAQYEEELYKNMMEQPGLSMAKRAMALGWFYSNGKAHTTRVNSTLASLVSKDRAVVEDKTAYAISDETGDIIYGEE
jgi:RecA-family ATPase